ncbi:IS66 family insertion sequence element accessory protein TnpB, partial [Paracraurococcus ruber]|uniref:Transposase n=1 Tax=Paracraurococcus ruber TaxID=77675 RepID=A0ABS1CZZ5_9PROT
MLALHAGMRVHLALGATDMRKGFDGLAAQVQTVLQADPFSGHLFLFRGRRGDRATFCILSLRDLAAAWRHLSDTLEDSSAGAPSRAVGRR